MAKNIASIGAAATLSTADLRKQFITDATENNVAAVKQTKTLQHGAFVLMILAQRNDFRDRDNKVLQIGALLAGSKPSADIPSPRIVALAMFNPSLPGDKTKWTPADQEKARLFEVQVKFTASCVDLAQRLLQRQTNASHFDIKMGAFAPMLSAFPRKGETIAEKDMELGTRIPLSGASVIFKNDSGAKFERRINLAEFLRATATKTKGRDKPSQTVVINKATIDALSSLLMNTANRTAFLKVPGNADAMAGLLANIAEYMTAEMVKAMSDRDALNQKIAADATAKGKRNGKVTKAA